MPDRVRVTVAPGASITLDPHPSGVARMKPLVLRGGDTLLVEPAEAERLYQVRRVLHPETGQVRPADPQRRDPFAGRVTFSVNGGPARDGSLMPVDPCAGTTPELNAREPRRVQVLGADPTFPMLEPIETSDGRVWPPY